MGQLQAAQSTLARELPAGVDTAAILRVLALFFWRWFQNNREDTLVKRRILIFSVTIKVKDLRPLFVSLFGEPPIQV